MAQAPQGFTYQGVATDNNGFELQNQTISIQASLLSSSATGTTVWQETHNTTTDTFGLFNVVIGEGTSTNSGSSATFSEIDWGAASHFMKVEIDVNGGSNYVHVGTSQMMSVPYALYADKVNMDSVINYLTNDSAFMDSVGAYKSGNSTNTYGGTMPSWVYNTGMCSDNLPELFQTQNNIVSSGNMSLNGDHSFCNFTLNANDTLTIDGNYLILRVADTLTINGIVNGNGKVGSTIGQGVSGGWGGSAGGMATQGGNGYATVISAGASYSYDINGNSISSNGSVVDSSFYYQMILNDSKIYGAQGGNGGSTRYWDAWNASTYGGNGGAGLIIICKHLQFSGAIILNGLDGEDGYTWGNNGSNVGISGGGGGGGGGSLIVNAENIISNTGIININGGLGGASTNIYFSQFSTSFYSSWYSNPGNPGGNGFILWIGDQ